ncbi:ATPase, T2SS/T4P/T4SS family [Anaerobium acetethylicum]|nr:ATPase, T2SS/T4P/T4SS family [Anaerobium acetethylicum]
MKETSDNITDASEIDEGQTADPILSGTSEKTEAEQDDETILDDVINHFVHVEKRSLNMMQRGMKTKEDFLKEVEAFMQHCKVQKEQIQRVSGKFEKFIWGYHVLESLIYDESISDIKVLNEDNIRIKRYGNRLTSDVKFRSREDYRRFVDLVAVKNMTNLSDINAIQNFTDKDSCNTSILRFNIATAYVNSVDIPYLHIRKIPKNKPSMEKLIQAGMLTKEKAEYLKRQAVEASGILFTGKGASGKTTLMNVMLEKIPHDRSGLVIQENEELFSKSHPDLMFQHVVTSKGEGKIQYGLKDLARNGLLTDLDYFIIGEVKGGEALYLLNASYTGHKCWASVHGMNSTQALDKLADYIKYESDYSKEDAMKMLAGIKTVVYMENFMVKEISEVAGWNEEHHRMDYRRIF